MGFGHSINNVVRSKKRKLSETAAQTNIDDEETHEDSNPQEFSDDEGNIYGARVNGFWWGFYVIPVSEVLLSSMDSNCDLPSNCGLAALQ
jgi:hypothetical protein